jgi:glycosyltransferase involved in cell wall biosynthesis
MRILIFHNLLWSQYKSVIFEKLNYELSVNNESEVLVIQTAITEKSRKDMVDFNLSEFPFNYHFKLISKRPLEQVSLFLILYTKFKYIIQFRPYVVNFTGYNETSTIFLLLICKIFKIKTIITNESIDKKNQNQSIKNKVKFLYKVFLFKISDGFFSYGIQSNEYLFKHKVPKTKILSFLNTFDKKKFILSNDHINFNSKYILFVGRLSIEKNIPELIDAFQKIQSQLKDLHLIIIGNGPEYNKIVKLIKKMNLENNILLLGTIQWNVLAQYYRNAECLFLASKSETWGMVANEAQEMQLPVISTNYCGCSNDLVINNYSGLVLNGDVKSEENIQIIIDYLSNNKKNTFQRFIQNNKKIFDSERVTKEMIRGFSHFLDK